MLILIREHPDLFNSSLHRQQHLDTIESFKEGKYANEEIIKTEYSEKIPPPKKIEEEQQDLPQGDDDDYKPDMKKSQKKKERENFESGALGSTFPRTREI